MPRIDRPQPPILSNPIVELLRRESEDDAVPLDLSMPKSACSNGSQRGQDVTDIIQIFTQNIAKSTSSVPTARPSSRGCRLKHHTVGEVLNTEEVMERLREHEEMKRKKGSTKGRKPGHSKKQKK